MSFEPRCLATTIGSLPHSDALEAARLMLRFTPRIPAWVQLSKRPQEGMLVQFTEGLPGFHRPLQGGNYFDVDAPSFQNGVSALYENYLAVFEEHSLARLESYAISRDSARGFHALLELLWAWRRGELRAEVTAVISNHPDLGQAVANLGVPFRHIPNTAATRTEAEARMAEAIGNADLVVLARYMQIISPEFVARWPERIINIHHSFLPAFVGADPYRQAYDRGVKVVGATAHYVTAELDAGPIIEQDVARVSHRDSVDALKQLGRDLERRVLARAVRWHCEDRVIVHGNKTVVFS